MKNIKGIILGMVFVFGMSYTADANATTILEMDDCAISAIESLESFQDMGALQDSESAGNYLNDFYADCIG
ncbi:MAG: hypothetical protein COA67_06790 [Lutibacter sp.]|nr:MAG: hypothetical protein COA67_06790 [Lutibacter sp.]